MTAHLLAKVVQSQYDKINVDDMSAEFDGIQRYKYGRISDEWVNKQIENEQYHKWIRACYLLEEHIKRHFETFVETELVYTWAKTLCEERNKFLNRRRMGLDIPPPYLNHNKQHIYA